MIEDFRVKAIFIYPVKSLAGIRVETSNAEIRGFQYDRRWMITDRGGNYITQKEIPTLALIKTAFRDDGIAINSPVLNRETLFIPFDCSSDQKIKTRVFQDDVNASLVGKVADEWFSDSLGKYCRLVYMDDDSERLVNRKYAVNTESVSFANSFPYLVISEASLEDLNKRLVKKINADRFRPNIVIDGGEAYFEDQWNEFSAGNAVFKCAKACARCKIINIDQKTSEIDDEPLTVLSEYRRKDDDINFGYRSLCLREGIVKVGDRVSIISKKQIVKKI